MTFQAGKKVPKVTPDNFTSLPIWTWQAFMAKIGQLCSM